MRRLLGTTAIALLMTGTGIGAAQAQLQACGQGVIDANADGVIDADERQAYELGVYNGTDFNGDGVVSRSEYCFDPSAIEPAAGPVILLEGETTTESGMMEHDLAAQALVDHFRSFDANGDGKISREEWTGVDDDEYASAGAQGDYFDWIDDDLDGHVTLQEFAEARGVPYDRARREADAS